MAKRKKATEVKILVTDETIFQRNEEDFLISEVDGEAVMMNNNNGHYWGLNESSTDIWNILEKESTFKGILDSLMEKYDVDEITCRKESLNVLAGMVRVNIIKINDAK